MDQSHPKAFLVMENRVQAGGIWTAFSSSGLMADALVKDMPEVEYAVATHPASSATLSVNDEKNISVEGKYAGKDFFHIFSYPLLRGNVDQVLADKSGIVLSDALARTLFGTIDGVVGKTVTLEHQQTFAVSGIFEEPGVHSSDQFQFVLLTQVLADKEPAWANWDATMAETYVTLRPGASVDAFNAKLADYIKRKTNQQTTYRTPFLQRYGDVYLHGHYEGGKQAGGRIDYIHLFSLIALFIVVIACINFMNLSTARAAGRAKEVGIKKVVGAGRGTLIAQYLGESLLMAGLSMLLALLLVLLFLPVFNGITGKHLDLSHPGAGLVFSLAGITLLTGLVAGSYPALYLSGFKPASVLKGRLKNTVGELLIRKGLVVFQFTLSVVLILGVLVVYRQIRYVQTKNLGYDRDNVLSFPKEGKLMDPAQREAFLSEVRDIPGVVHASVIGHDMVGHNNGTYMVDWAGKDPQDKTEFELVPVDYDMLETLGVSLKEGRSFSPAYGSDSTKIIFNEEAIRFMGLEDPIGKKVTLWGKPLEIVGVARDFHFQSLHERITPQLFWLAPDAARHFMIKIRAGQENTVIPRLEALYRQFNPGFSMDYTFLDDSYQALYVAEQRVSTLSRYFAGLAILISCLGLFGLTAFTAERRRKEIGIRKVLGATVSSVVLLLSKEFLLLVWIALVPAFPLAWWMAGRWLSGFAYRISIGAGVFVAAGAAITLITLCTVSFLSVKAALANPTQSLKAE